jgi:hypothetical protein
MKGVAVRRTILSVLSLTLVTAGPLSADTFDRTPIAPELGVDALDKSVAQQHLGRALFSNPYATVTLGNIDVYDVFPYIESRHFQIVSDPGWNRLVFGEVGQSLRAYDGAGSSLGALSGPRGMAVDEQNRVYVADTGNNRVVVLQAVTEFDDIQLVPVFEIRDLGGPYDVALSDGGTPFEAGDDFLYVAETGKNRVSVYALEGSRAAQVAVLGDLGSGPGRFAGPMAITTGRSQGASTTDVYVADAHNRRIVHLRHEGAGFTWIEEREHEADVLTSLDTDNWGNLYAAAPNRDAIYKYNSDLSPVAALEAEVSRPRSFHVPFLNVRDHRSGTVERMGQRSGLAVEGWTDASGIKLWNLGVEVADLAVVEDDSPSSRFTLTDQAEVRFEIADAKSGQVLASRDVGSLGAGLHTIALSDDELARAAGGERLLRVTARSSYSDGPSDVAQASFTVSGVGGVLPPNQPMLLGNSPNPALNFTRIAFLLPSGVTDPVSLNVYDARGRLVRKFESRFAPGLNEIDWDGRNNAGSSVSAGVYFYRLKVGAVQFTRRMVFVR